MGAASKTPRTSSASRRLSGELTGTAGSKGRFSGGIDASRTKAKVRKTIRQIRANREEAKAQAAAAEKVLEELGITMRDDDLELTHDLLHQQRSKLRKLTDADGGRLADYVATSSRTEDQLLAEIGDAHDRAAVLEAQLEAIGDLINARDYLARTKSHEESGE